MSLQVRVKLKLSKERRKFHVEYNTYEKATFDRYLLASLCLRAKNEKEAFSYIDDITGEGSLNGYFKKMYEQVSKLDQNQLSGIIKNSLFPILKVDESQWYDYYELLNTSIFKRRTYSGDMTNLEWNSLLQIPEELLVRSVKTDRVFDKPEPYEVKIDDDGVVTIVIENESHEINSSLFESLLVNELSRLSDYQGTIHRKATGTGWMILTDSVLSSFFQDANYYYNDDGDLCLIRQDSVRNISIAKVSGLVIYRENKISYFGNPGICDKAYRVLTNNFALTSFPAASLCKIISQMDKADAVISINAFYMQNRDNNSQITELGLRLLMENVMDGWSQASLNRFIAKANPKELTQIYRADPTLDYSLPQLLSLSFDLLIPKHQQIILEMQSKIQSIQKQTNEIVGEITNSGLRERSKQLESDLTTKKFTKLCNELIGHAKEDLSKATLEEAQARLKQAEELKQLSIIIERRLADSN